MSHWDPMFGYLSNRLPDYLDTVGLHVSVQTQRKGDRPLLTVKTMDHRLAADQSDGISLENLLKIVGPFLEH